MRRCAAPDGLATLPAVVAGIFNPGEPPGVVQRTDFASRAAGLADEIEATEPDLIGLQEAAQWRTDDTVAADHLDLLEAELARRGLPYRRVAAAVNGDVALPSAAGFNVGLSDREAILAREDVVTARPFVRLIDARGDRRRSRARLPRAPRSSRRPASCSPGRPTPTCPW